MESRKKTVDVAYVDAYDILNQVSYEFERQLLEELTKHIRILRLPPDILPGGDIKPSEYLRRLGLMLKRIEEHAAYFYVSFSNLSDFYLARDLSRSSIPFIVTAHGLHQNNINEWLAVSPLLREEDIVLAPSKTGKKLLDRISDNIMPDILPYGIDYSRISRKSFETANRRMPSKKMVYMGQLVEEKNVHTLISCMPGILREVPEASLRIIGPRDGYSRTDSNPPSTYYRHMEKLCMDFGISSKVEFGGVAIADHKYTLLSEGDVFVYPTTAWYENFPVCILEALACGKPVVCSRWSGIREFVKHGKNGFLVDVEFESDACFNPKRPPSVDKDALTEFTVRLLLDDRLAERMGKAGMRTAEAHDYRRVIPELISKLDGTRRKRKTSVLEDIWDRRIFDLGVYNPDFVNGRCYQNVEYSALCEKKDLISNMQEELNNFYRYFYSQHNR